MICLIEIVTENKSVSRLPKSNNSAERGRTFEKFLFFIFYFFIFAKKPPSLRRIITFL